MPRNVENSQRMWDGKSSFGRFSQAARRAFFESISLRRMGRTHFASTPELSFCRAPYERGPAEGGCRTAGAYIAVRSLSRRERAWSLAVLLPGTVFVGSSPARMNPWPAPSYVTGSYFLPAACMAAVVAGTVAPIRASLPA